MFKYLKNIFRGTEEYKRKQLVITVIVGIIVLTIFGYIIYRIEKQTAEEYKETIKEFEEEANKVEIETSLSKVKPEEVWRYKIESEGDNLKDTISQIKQTLDKEISAKETKENIVLKTLENKLTLLEERVAEQESLLAQSAKERDASTPTQPQEDADINNINSNNIQKITLNLSNPIKKDYNNIENTIVAGSFAKATLLGGVDASTAMSASSDPRPILLRLIDQGTLPNQFKSKLKDCHIIASSYGDISSERVYGRLEKLSCVVKNTGRIIETEVAGYIAGEDRRVGIRGTVVAKDTQLLMNSLGVGVLSGIGKTITPQAGILHPFDSGNKYLKGPSAQDHFKQGFGEGTSGALDRLSQYYIDKAENIQPVVQVSAGRTVDVVFTAGVIFGSSNIKEQLESSRKEAKE
jgi:conjugal transfer pilus assembly protein TraB